MTALVMPQVRHADSSGIETFWVDSDADNVTARLAFRAGMVDETHRTHGIAHLAEHVFHGPLRPPGTLATNASTTTFVTAFDFAGPRSAVTAAVDQLCARIREGEVPDLATEANILRAEANARGSSRLTNTLYQRWGCRPIAGLADSDEVYLDAPDPDEVARFAQRHYVAENAVLLLDGSPLDLSEPLPSGVRLPVPDLPGPGLCRVCTSRPALGLSGLVTGDPETMDIAARALEWVLTQRLRVASGSAYAPDATSLRLTRDGGLLMAASELSQWDAPLCEELLADLQQLAELGPLPDLVAELIASRETGFRDPQRAFSYALFAGTEALRGYPVLSPEERWDHVHAATPERLAVMYSEFCDTMLLGCPDTDVVPAWLPPRPEPTVDPASGERWHGPYWPLNPTLCVLGPETFGVTDGQDCRALRWDEVMEVHDLSNGLLTIYDLNGDGLTLDPRDWVHAESLRDAVLQRLRGRDDIVVRPVTMDPLPSRKVYPYDRLLAYAYGSGPKGWLVIAAEVLLFLAAVLGALYLGVVGRWTMSFAGMVAGVLIVVLAGGMLQERRHIMRVAGRTSRRR